MASLPASARRAALYQRAVREAFASSKKTAGRRGEVNVVFLGRAAMLRMNRHYLAHDYDTDVIAFSHEVPPEVVGDDRPLGDIFISSWMTRRQAKALGHSPAAEAATLAVHGALHLTGHDDHRPAAKARMFKVQDRIVASLRV
ncbi:MAG: rRNA maturation RNase YbeY [Elusimicrobia bacterium]|nr:rRNA maturation RNase YbeY [Elusimicrobiota bacterium]